MESSKDNTFPLVAGYTVVEMEGIVSVIQTNISLAQRLYRSAVEMMNTSSDVRLGFVMAHSSLTELQQYLNVLTTQHQLYTEKLRELNDSYQVR